MDEEHIEVYSDIRGWSWGRIVGKQEVETRGGFPSRRDAENAARQAYPRLQLRVRRD
jgi:hypothetical protein